EVKHVQDNADPRLNSNLDTAPDSYQLMYREAEVFAQSAEQEKYLVSKDSILRGLKTDIERTYVGNTKGIWNLHIVFKKTFSEKLVNLSVEDLNQKFAVVINADLMAAPISKDDFLAHRTDEGQLELIIPTNVRQKRFAEKILARYNM
ncbi:MAG: hypothetical protein KC618_06835, partial [Candidatus Omnitrophica bacterium]|nr:hypothetical protein [Candidatus Omnitrophota bacterium]